MSRYGVRPNRFVPGLLVLACCAIAAQDAGTDPRLSDPAFLKLRDEAVLATKCADRTNPVGVSTPKPKYPPALLGSHMAGTAVTEGIVSTDGKVDYARVMKTNDPEFGKAAMEVFKRYRFKPATCGGKPVPAFVSIMHTFSVQ